MKKILKSMLGLSMILFVGISICLGKSFSDQFNNEDTKFPFGDSYQNDPRSDIPEDVYIVSDNNDESIISKLLDVFNINIDKNSNHKFLDYVKAILNIALGLTSMIALVMTIYTFYLMFFTENDAGAKKAKGNLVGIFIALAIIGLSWLIVSFIFRWYGENWEGRRDYIGGSESMSMINRELTDQIYFNV